MGERLKDGQLPTEGEVWFADATLLLFPIASYSHQFVWITCPLWLSRWNRWLKHEGLEKLIVAWRSLLTAENGKKAITSVAGQQIYLQGAVLKQEDLQAIDKEATCWECLAKLPNQNGILDLKQKLLALSDEDCAGLVETGLQREVRVALKPGEKIVEGSTFRSEESIPSETLLFFPWGLKKENSETNGVGEFLRETLSNRLQFGGLEGLGRGWVENVTVELDKTGK